MGLVTGRDRKNHLTRFRLTDEEDARLARFGEAHGLNRSQTLRTLVGLALDGVRASDSAALAKRVYREGFDAGVYSMRVELGQALQTISQDRKSAVSRRDTPREVS